MTDTTAPSPGAPAGSGAAGRRPFYRRRKVCPFTGEGAPKIDYKDVKLLQRYISERGKIRARRVTGNCVQHQRDIAIAVKNAREVALLPFTSASR